MRPAVAILLLVALMFMSDCAAAPTDNLDAKCSSTATPCVSGEEGWYQMGEGRCVKAFNTQPLNFADAEKACNQYTSGNDDKGHLVSIHNYEELDAVVCSMYRVTPGRPPYWIGLYLSFHYEDYLVYDWTDATEHDFSYFAYMQPNFYRENEECVETNYNSWGQWNDLNCNFTRPYVCAVNV